MKIGTGNAGGVSPSAVYSFSALPSYAISYVYEPVLAYENLPSGALTNSICQTTSDSTFWQFDGTSWIELGSSAALGDATIWQTALDWASLPTEDLRNGDRVLVQDLGQPSSYGFAEYDDTDWYLVQAFFLSEADLNEFTQLKKLGAIAYILDVSTVPDAQDGAGVVYYYNGAIWVRTPKDTAYIHPAVATVSDVLSITSPRNGDQVFVADTGYETGGYAIYVAESNMWKLYQGWFSTVNDMEAFSTDPDTVQDYAIASVGSYGPAYPHYVFNVDSGEWLRTPDGAHYIWPQVNDWSLLATDRPHAINNDEVHVHTLGTSYSSGTAQKHGGGWWLIEGKWASVTDMDNWSEGTIKSGAIGLVDASNAFDENATSYFYTGSSWVRMAEWLPGTFALSSLQDFSGVGLKEGDYGVFTPSGGQPILLRYKAVTPRAAGAGSGNIQAWLPPEVYAGSPTLQAYLVGTESAGTLAGQGFTVFTSGAGGSVSSVGGFVRCTDGNVASSSASLGVTALSGTITATTKIYVRFRCRAPAVAGTPFALNLRDGTSVISWAAGSTLYVGGSGTPPASIGASSLRNSGTALPTTTGSDWLEFLAEGTAVMNRMTRNGAEYAAVRTSVGLLTATSNIFFGDLTGTTTNSTIEFADMQVFTW